MKNLQFQNKKYRIMLVGDPHCRPEDDTKHEQDVIKDYLSLQYAALEAAEPDLVVLMGDNAGGNTPEEVRETLLRITQPYVQTDTPFTFILGNHDLQYAGMDLKTLYRIYASLPGIIMPEDITDFGDFRLSVRDPETGDSALELLCVYSGSNAEARDYSVYDYVQPEQLRWIKATTEETTRRCGHVPTVVFQHIPVPEEYALLKESAPFVMLGGGVAGQNETRGKFFTKRKGVEGYFGEAPCSPGYNSKEFEVFKETGSVFAAFFGHDHLNDFVGMHDGIILGQCKTASFNVYGDGLRQGVRILDFRQDAPFVLDTHMLRYRDLLGKKCRSLSGSIAVLHDKTSMKLHAFGRVGIAAAVIALPPAIIRAAKQYRNKRK